MNIKWVTVRTGEWLKTNRRNILLSVTGILIILLSFAAGYITARDFTKIPIVIQKSSK